MIDDKKRIWIQRIAQYLIGLTIMAFGIAMAIRSDIGVPPGGAIAVAVSNFVPLTIGQCSALFHAFCVVAQIVITRKPTVKHAFQLPLAYAFGFVMDIFLDLLLIDFPSIVFQVLFVLGGMVILSFGIRMIVGANLLFVPPDGLARTMGAAFGMPMSKGKLMFDIAATTTAMLLTLILARNAFLVVGVGTVICAIGTGPLIGVYTKLIPFFDCDKESQQQSPPQQKTDN